MSINTLLKVPEFLSRLNQAYSLIDSSGNIHWTNTAFDRLIEGSAFLKLCKTLSLSEDAYIPHQVVYDPDSDTSFECEIQAYPEIDPEDAEDLYLCLCRKVDPLQEEHASEQHDIHRRRMTSLLNESQKLAKIGAWEYNLLTHTTVWTEEVYRIHEVGLDFKPNGPNGISFYHVDDQHIITDSIRRALEKQEPFDIIARFITAKNNQIWVRVTGKPYMENGIPVRLIGLIQDITEKIEIKDQLIEEQAQLRNFTERFRLASKAAGIGVWDYYPLENNLVWDEQMYNLYGVKKEEFAGAYEAWENRIHPEDKEEAVSELEKALSGEKEFNTQFRIVLSDGTIRHLSGVATVIRNEKKEPLRMIGVNLDITERTQHLNELNLLQSVVETSLDAVLIMKAENEFQEILYANPAHEKMTGFSLEDVKGKFPTLFHGPKTDPLELARVQDLLQKGVNIQSQLLNYDKEGKEYWINMIITYVRDQSGEISHFVSVQRDITNQKMNQQALLEAKELAESASAAKSEFLSTMSHEIRTPLNAVIGMTGLLAETQLNEEQKNYINTIRHGGENLLSVINDILDYSKIEAGKVELEQEKFSILVPIENTLDLLSKKAFEKGIELMYVVDKSVPQYIMGDITRLRQILVNLIGNAIKFTDDGEILVQVHKVGEKEKKVRLEFSIKDTGIGIPQEKIKRLFQSFSQIDASTTRKFGGTGLGLAISQKLVELQGGEIWVESTEGVGSTFIFTVEVEKVNESSNLHLDLSTLADKRILLIDDVETNLEILAKQMREAGMQVSAFSSPKAAAALIEKKTEAPWDLCLFDFQMPEMSASQLAKVLKQIPAYKDIPLVALNPGYILDKDSEKDLFEAILSKPVRKEKLISRISELLNPDHLKNKDPLPAEKKTELDISDFHILLAEDNTINQKVAKKMLEKFKGKLEVATNGLEALDFIKIRSFDLVLMDMQMPEMDGVQATLAIRQLKGIKQPLILAMTANVSEEDRKICLEAGMNDFISKPIKLDVLRDTLRKWLL